MAKSRTKSRKNLLARITASSLFLAGSLGLVATAAAQQATVAEVRANELPDSPSATLAKLQQAAPLQDAPQTSTQSSSTTNSIQPVEVGVEKDQQPQPAAPAQQTQPSLQKPEGTAAAESAHASGVAASQPTGVAIAPAKQRRVRTIWIRTGAIIGAGVAVGSVVALTAGTSSKPPGAH